MFVLKSQYDASVLEGSTLIIPSISLGNVPQLTVDLLIENLKIPRLGLWYTEALIPVSGPAAYSHLASDFDFSFNGEVYFDQVHNLTLLQFRAPIFKGLMANFVNELCDVISFYKFKNVIVLTSYDMTLRLDSQIQNPHPRWLCHTRTLKPSIALPSEFEQLEFDFTEDDLSKVSKNKHVPQLPGSGFARKLLLLAREKAIDQLLALITFVSEGDNRFDALQLASSLNRVLNVKPDCEWKFPPSWNMLFGTEMPADLYN